MRDEPQPLLVRLSRYAKREDRLTEAFAAILERVPGLAWRLARAWTDPSVKTTAFNEALGRTSQAHDALRLARQLLDVQTQMTVYTSAGDWKFIDLALRFGTSQGTSWEDVWLWIEVKHGAAPHESQLANYVDAMHAEDDSYVRAVVLLAPQGDLPGFARRTGEPMPPEVARRTWEATARVVADAQEQADVRTLDEFLLDELHRFLFWEGLSEPAVIDADHLAAYDVAWEAETALKGLCERVSKRLEDLLGPPSDWLGSDRGPKKYGYAYYEAWALDEEPQGLRGRRWLDWSAYRSVGHPIAPRGGLFFMSGLVVESDEPLMWPGEPAAFARLEAGVSLAGKEIRFARISDDCERLARTSTPAVLLDPATDLDKQAHVVSDWVVDGFSALARELPEGSGSWPAALLT